MIYPPNQKPPIWSIDPGIIAYNCQKHGIPHPVLAMPMWEGAGDRALDYSGHGNHGILTNGPNWVADKIDFDGSDDFINISNTDGLNVFNNKITISCWVKADSVAIAYQKIICRRNSASDGYIYFVDFSYNHIRFQPGTLNIITSNTYSANKWYNIIVVYDGLDGEIYINGVLDGTNSSIITLPDSTQPATIGARYNVSHPFNGIISNPLIFNSALSAAQIKFLWNNPYFMYEIPEELYGYVEGVPPVIFIPRIIMF